MNISPALKKSMPVLGKFGIWLGISALAGHLTDSTELTDALATAGVGAANLSGACEIVKGLASGKLSDYYKEFRANAGFGINHDLQRAMGEGITNALTELNKSFGETHTLSGDERKQTDRYINSLAAQLSEAVRADAQIDEYTLSRQAFFHNLLKKVHALPTGDSADETESNVLLPELADETAQQLIVFLTENLEPYAYRYINEELKANDKAKTAYFIHLLEYSARVNQENSGLLQLVSSSLNDVGQRQQEHTDLLRSIAQAQQRIYDSLRKLQFDFQAYVRDFDAFRERVSAKLEPSLTLSVDYHNLTPSFSYQYGLRYTTFISRAEETNRLWDFLTGQPDRKMLWWLATGPGGMGKSRLALEFCLEAQCLNRYVGFVESTHLTGFDWSQWRPAYPTLLVVDYVAAYAEPARQLLGQLSRSAQNNKLTQPVRVLLLERETRDDWWTPFLNDRDVVESSYVAGNPGQLLSLRPFTDDDRWQLVTEVHRKQAKPVTADRAQILGSLAEIDPEGRPLFAFLTGMALAEGEDIRHWDVHDLLNNLLAREEHTIWQKHPKWADERCRDGHKNLLVLTTLTRGLTVAQLKALMQQALAWLPAAKVDSSLYDQLADIRKRVLPTGQTETVYDGLQPDIVGEYYVLKRLSQLLTDDFSGEETVQDLLQTAWTITPEETWWSIWRTLSDFSRFPNADVHRSLFLSQPAAGSSETAWEYWARLQINLAHPDSPFADKAVAYGNLQTLTKAYPHNQEIVLNQAKGAMNLTTYYGSQQCWPEAQAAYADLQTLTRAYPRNEEIVLQQAKGAMNLTTDYGSQQCWPEAQAAYADLQTLTKAYPHNQEIVLNQAKGAYNLTTHYGSQQCWPEAQAAYADLQTLTKAYPRNEEIVLQQAKGAYNLTTYYGSQQCWPEAQAAYADLQTLTKAYPHNQEIVLNQAKGAMNLTNYYGSQQCWPEAQAAYADLQTLTRAYPHNQEIVLRQAKGAMNLTNYYGSQQCWPEAQAAYADLQTLTKAYPHNQEIVLRQAQGAYNLTTHYGSQQCWPEAQAAYADLQTLTRAYPHNQEIVLIQAQGAMNLTNYYGTQQRWPEAQAAYADLQTLTKAYPNNQEIVLNQAMGAGGQLYFASETEKIQQKLYFLPLLQDLESLLATYRTSPVWQEMVPLLSGTIDDNRWLKSADGNADVSGN